MHLLDCGNSPPGERLKETDQEGIEVLPCGAVTGEKGLSEHCRCTIGEGALKDRRGVVDRGGG